MTIMHLASLSGMKGIPTTFTKCQNYTSKEGIIPSPLGHTFCRQEWYSDTKKIKNCMERVPENGSGCDSNNESCEDASQPKKVTNKKKPKKRGIIYLSTIPPYMNVSKIREVFSQFGDVGRIYLQSSAKPGEKRKRVPNLFTEGWVEFEKKRIAKSVAVNLNNTKIGTRKRSRYFDMIWNIKYIPRFKWIHLSERLAYERAAIKQRLRAEISQAKKEAHYLQNNIEKSKKLKKRKLMQKDIGQSS